MGLLFDKLFEVERQETHEAMLAPRAGDRFAELYSFYVYVLQVNPSEIVTLEASPPCTFPQDGKLQRHSPPSEFARRFRYEYSDDQYWVHLVERDTNITGWLEAKEPQ